MLIYYNNTKETIPVRYSHLTAIYLSHYIFSLPIHIIITK